MRDTGFAPILHVGGEPSATQRALIEQVVWLTVKCSLIGAKISAATDNDYDSNSYLGWSNALPRALHDLGTEPAGVRSPSIADVLKDRAGGMS